MQVGSMKLATVIFALDCQRRATTLVGDVVVGLKGFFPIALQIII
jgi:hypothetical protein